jgi:hypothetical protein
MAVGSDASRFGCRSGLVRATGMTAALAILRPSDSQPRRMVGLSPLVASISATTRRELLRDPIAKEHRCRRPLRDRRPPSFSAGPQRAE